MTPSQIPSLSTNPAPTILVLSNGCVVPSAFYERIKQHVQERLPTLSLGKVKSLEQICCPKFWNAMSVGDRITAGKCVSNMVTTKELPLLDSPQKHEYPKKYSRI